MGATTRAKCDQPIFYVYECWRPDIHECFWVGKGHGGRAQNRRRNFHFTNVVKKLEREGLDYQVRIVADGLTEPVALAYEIDLIAHWRALGAPLTNITEGGEGVCGLKHSAETRAKIKAAIAGKPRPPCSEQTKKKLRIAHKGRGKGVPNPAHSERLKGRKLSDEHRAAISASRMGRQFSAETRAKISESNRGQRRSEETCERLRVSHLGKKQSPELIEKRIAPLRGIPRSDEVKAKISEAQKGRPKSPEAIAKMKATQATPEYRASMSGENWHRRRNCRS